MGTTIVLGAGITGLASALMPARDGERVIVLERDADPVPDRAAEAWRTWRRDGVAQFHQPHLLHARGRAVLDEELPDVVPAAVAAGARRLDRIAGMRRGSPRATGGARLTADLEVIGCLALPGDVLRRPGLADRIAAPAADGDPVAGPGREQLLGLLGGPAPLPMPA